MPRTTANEVAKIFDTELTTSNNGQLEAWIEIANELVDDIADADSSIDSTRLTQIEKLLAAHLAATQDRRVESESRESARIDYQGETGMRITATGYGQQASMLDPTGQLASLGKPGASVTTPDAKDIGN